MMRNPRGPHLAFDRSSRSYDQQSGHLMVKDNVLTSAGISPYYGREIPGYAKLGLDPNRIYKMLRPADELRRAAASLAGKPVLIEHLEISADSHPHRAVVGAIGSDVVFDGEVVRASLSFWTRDAIEAIEHGGQRSLSCGYWYEPQMVPGAYQGAAFDGIMKSLKFNHLALVVEPRVAGAMVGDSALKRRLNMDDDDLSELLKFLAPRLEDADLKQVKTMLGVDDDDQPAMDAAIVRQRQRAAEERMQIMADSRAAMKERFPNAFRLKHSA